MRGISGIDMTSPRWQFAVSAILAPWFAILAVLSGVLSILAVAPNHRVVVVLACVATGSAGFFLGSRHVRTRIGRHMADGRPLFERPDGSLPGLGAVVGMLLAPLVAGNLVFWMGFLAFFSWLSGAFGRAATHLGRLRRQSEPRRRAGE